LSISGEIDGHSVDSIENHACKGYDYRNDNSNRNKTACKCSIFSFLLISQQLI
jgi:hypothetical protein